MFHWSQTIWRCFCRYRTQIWRKTVSHMQLHYFCRKKNSCVSWNKINELDLTKRYLKMNVHIFGNSVFVLVTVKIIFYTIAYRKIFSFYFYSQNWNKFKHVTLATLKVYLSGIKTVNARSILLFLICWQKLKIKMLFWEAAICITINTIIWSSVGKRCPTKLI